MVEENRTAEYTDLQLQFLNLVSKYPVKAPETIVDYVSSQGEDVLENPEKLATSLSECEITPVRRRQILKHWFADKGVEIPPEVLKRAVLPPQERRKLEREEIEERERQVAKYGVDEDSGVIKVASTSEKALTWLEAKELSKAIKKELAEKGGKKVGYIYDVEKGEVRMAKEGEVGGTLEQAKELKKMGEEGKKREVESPFIQDKDGNWQINPTARITGLELMAFDAIKRAQERGEPVEPLEALGQAAEKIKVYREALGGGATTLPAWMTDPAEFIRTIRTISPEAKADEGLKEQITALTNTVNEMKEEKYRDQITSQQQQIQALTGEVRDLKDYVVEMKRPVTGRTEMDILHEVAYEGIGLAKTELAGLRRDVREVFGSTALPPPKTPEQREQRKVEYRAAIEKDKEIEELGNRLFFGENPLVKTEPAPEPEEKPPKVVPLLYE